MGLPIQLYRGRSACIARSLLTKHDNLCRVPTSSRPLIRLWLDDLVLSVLRVIVKKLRRRIWCTVLYKIFDFYAPRQQHWAESIMFSGCPSVCPSVRPVSVFRDWMKLCTNIHHVSGHCRKDYLRQLPMSNRIVSKVKKSRSDWPETAYLFGINNLKSNNLLVSNNVNGRKIRFADVAFTLN